MELSKIVITGGPCAGKTTAMSWIQNAFVAKGYTVLFIGETATEFIRGGVAPWTCGTNLDYQKVQTRLQREKEKLFERAARTMNAEKILIVCDRGCLDNKAYMTPEEFAEVLSDIHTNEVELRDSYDAVFHLVSAAKGAEEFYTTANNAARTETVEQARVLDDKLIAAWTGHPHLRVIDNATDFEVKMHRLLAEISSFLGESAPYLTQRKFLIKRPDAMLLDSLKSCTRVEISQTYLRSPTGKEMRIRQRGSDGHYIYFQKMLRNPADPEKVNIERRLDKDEYLKLLMEADPAMRQIRKTRYCLTYGNRYFELDLYPFLEKEAVLKVPLRQEDDEIRFPKWVEILEEITDDPRYTNYALATRFNL
ncbi:MAG: AAA family ATPase [Bacilli bacterium]|nr:AAA family ATPase [Bacilli bacterium]MDY6392866.1 AAA family ATPase [Bacilli bacterium]